MWKKANNYSQEEIKLEIHSTEMEKNNKTVKNTFNYLVFVQQWYNNFLSDLYKTERNLIIYNENQLTAAFMIKNQLTTSTISFRSFKYPFQL